MKTTMYGAIGPCVTAGLLLAFSIAACGPEPRAVAPPPKGVESKGAIVLALSERDPFKRIQKLSHLLPILGPEAIPGTIAALSDPSVDVGAAEMELLVRVWAKYEPAKAFSWALTRPPAGLRMAAGMSALETWAKQDPAAALKGFAPLMVAPSLNTKALQVAFVRGWFDSGEPGLTDYIRNLGIGFERQRALSVFARKKIQQDGAESAMRWAESIPDEPKKFKLNAFRQMASELTKVDPAAGAAFCKAHCDGPFGSDMLKMIGERWAAHDGPAALEWLSHAPAGRVRDAAVRDAYRRWIYLDGDAAYAWAASIGRENTEPWFGAVAELYSMRISWETPVEAMAWVALIVDEDRRELSYITIARRWREKDESAADAWIAGSPLSQEARERAHMPPKRTVLPRDRKPKAGEDKAKAGDESRGKR